MHNRSLGSSDRRQSQASTSNQGKSSRVNSNRTGISLWHIEDGTRDPDGTGRVGSAGSGDAFITVPKGCYEEEVGSQKGLLEGRRGV